MSDDAAVVDYQEYEYGPDDTGTDADNGVDVDMSHGMSTDMGADMGTEMGADEQMAVGADEQTDVKPAKYSLPREFMIDIPADKDMCIIKWNTAGKQFTVPFLTEVNNDLSDFFSARSVMVSPLEMFDMQAPQIQECAASSLKFSIQFEDQIKVPVKSTTGFARFVFSTPYEADLAVASLQTIRETLTVNHDSFAFSAPEASTSAVVTKTDSVTPEPSQTALEPILHRLVYVGNLPPDVTEATLKEIFPDAWRVIFPRPLEGGAECSADLEQMGYAYMEFESSAVVTLVTDEKKWMTFGDHKLFVMKPVTMHKAELGLLGESGRLALMEKRKKLSKHIRAVSHPTKVAAIQKEITILQAKIQKDKDIRMEWDIFPPKERTTLKDATLTPTGLGRPPRGRDMRGTMRRGRGTQQGGLVSLLDLQLPNPVGPYMNPARLGPPMRGRMFGGPALRGSMRGAPLGGRGQMVRNMVGRMLASVMRNRGSRGMPGQQHYYGKDMRYADMQKRYNDAAYSDDQQGYYDDGSCAGGEDEWNGVGVEDGTGGDYYNAGGFSSMRGMKRPATGIGAYRGFKQPRGSSYF